jgi:hypothetical protein
MKKGHEQFGPKKLNLVRKGNPENLNSARLDVLVDEETSNLVMEGEDTGSSVERFLGDEYEYCVRVPRGTRAGYSCTW